MLRGVDQFPPSLIWSHGNVCRKNFGFNGRQVNFCRSNFDWMSLLKSSTADTKEECKDLLKDQRWNCQSVNKAPNYDDDLKKGSNLLNLEIFGANLKTGLTEFWFLINLGF